MRLQMFKMLVLALATTGLGSAAVAGSPEAAPPQVQEVAIPAFNWTGAYAGAQIGSLDSDLHLNGQNLNNNNTMSSSEIDASGLVAGIFAGYNWQPTGNIVFGVEGEVNFSDADKSGPGFPGPSFGFVRNGIKSEIDLSAALRGRIGYAMDRTLIYLAGGFAWADVSLDGTAIGGPGRFTYGETLTGWTLGAGVEHAFTQNWVARLDYRYSDFGSDTFNFVSGNGDLHWFKLNSETHEIKVGVAYKF